MLLEIGRSSASHSLDALPDPFVAMLKASFCDTIHSYTQRLATFSTRNNGAHNSTCIVLRIFTGVIRKLLHFAQCSYKFHFILKENSSFYPHAPSTFVYDIFVRCLEWDNVLKHISSRYVNINFIINS